MYSSEIFIHSAERWCSTNLGFTPTVGDLRGSVVLAYCAVFHRSAEICAEKLIGQRGEHAQSSSAWNEFYRYLSHDTIRRACEQESRNRFSEPVQVFFDWFPTLLDVRNLCAYEGHLEPTIVQAHQVVMAAKSCIISLDNIPEREIANFVAYIMLRSSGGVGQIRDRNYDEDLGFFDKLTKKRREKFSQ